MALSDVLQTDSGSWPTFPLGSNAPEQDGTGCGAAVSRPRPGHRLSDGRGRPLSLRSRTRCQHRTSLWSHCGVPGALYACGSATSELTWPGHGESTDKASSAGQGDSAASTTDCNQRQMLPLIWPRKKCFFSPDSICSPVGRTLHR